MACSIEELLAANCALHGYSERALREFLLIAACASGSGGGSNLSGSGSPSGVTTPTFIGQYYVDTSTAPNQIYVSTGLTSADWTLFGDEGAHYTYTPTAYDLVPGFALTGDAMVETFTFLEAEVTSLTVLDNTVMTAFNMPNLVTIGPPGTQAINQTRFFLVDANPALTSLTFPALTSILMEGSNNAGRVQSNTLLTSISFPAWTTVNAVAASLFISSNAALTSFSAPVFPGATTFSFTISGNVLLTSIVFTSLANTATLNISGNSVLTSINLPALVTTGAITLTTNTALTSISAPLLTTAASIAANGLANLTTVTLTSYLPTNGGAQNFGSGALTQASVDHILARAEANAAYVSGTITLNGGTNSTPSAAGLASKAVLVGRGVTVLNN